MALLNIFARNGKELEKAERGRVAPLRANLEGETANFAVLQIDGDGSYYKKVANGYELLSMRDTDGREAAQASMREAGLPAPYTPTKKLLW